MRTYLESSRAYTLFRFSAWWMVLLAGFLIMMVSVYDRIFSNDVTRTVFQVLGGCLGIVGAFAGLVIFFGMLIYMFLCDPSSGGRKTLWLLAFFFTAWFGSSLYFFLVYRKQVPQRAK